jgi:hypothetical protein
VTRVAGILALLLIACGSRTAAADGLRGIELAGALGYAAPLASAEKGSRVSDSAFGSPTFALDAGYRLTSFVGVALHAAYGVTIPTLCQNASGCEASLGSDFTLELAARLHVPRLGPFEPLVDVGLGYEWLTTRLVDAGVSSGRAYNGPVLLVTQIAAPLRLGERWTFGPVVGAAAGTFTRFGLQTPAQSLSGDVPQRAPHGWLTVGVRLGVSL